MSMIDIRELKQQRRQRLRKRHSKNEFALLQTLSRLFQLVQFVKFWQILCSSILKDCIKIQKKKKESRLRSLPRQNVNIGTFKKKRAKLLFCQCKPITCRSRCRRCRRCLSYLLPVPCVLHNSVGSLSISPA